MRRGPRCPRQPVRDSALPTRARRSSGTMSGHAADSPAVNCRRRVGLRAGEPEGAPPTGWFVVQIPGSSRLTDGNGGRRGQRHPKSEAVGRCSRGAHPTCLGVRGRYPERPGSAPGLGSGGLPAGAASCQGPGLRPSLSASSPRCPGTGDSSGGDELCPLSGGPGPAPGPTLAQLLSRGPGAGALEESSAWGRPSGPSLAPPVPRACLGLSQPQSTLAWPWGTGSLSPEPPGAAGEGPTYPPRGRARWAAGAGGGSGAYPSPFPPPQASRPSGVAPGGGSGTPGPCASTCTVLSRQGSRGNGRDSQANTGQNLYC